MCGIYGSTQIYPDPVIREKLMRVQFRGPDHTGWKNYEDKVQLGHNRLAIIDLDSRSNQPFEYEFTSIVYNGEIYNFQELRIDLEKKGYKFTTTSDTEVICAAYIAHGFRCAELFNGMFAFVIYDRKKNILFGARDRTGQKPFYYTLKDRGFEFASQPAQIAIANQLTLDISAVTQFLKWSYFPEPNSIYEEVKKLRSGHFFTYDLHSAEFREEKYWDIPSRNSFSDLSLPEAENHLHTLLLDAVRKRMIADVPLGVFLSGGVDSSLVSALAQSISGQPVRTFCVKFEEIEFDESAYARQVAEILGTNHLEIHCNYQEGLELIEDLPKYFDEPFGDASAIPSLLLSKHTRKHVTVALSGDAGDENFLGYKRYDRILERSRLFRIPQTIREVVAPGFALSPVRHIRATRPKGLRTKNINDFYYQKMATLDDSWIINPALGENYEHYRFLESEKPLLERVSDFDIKTYLTEDVNTKQDRATMAFSLEGRSPLLDFRVIEFARSLPTNYKYRDGDKKHILKKVLYRYLPQELFVRKKRGFAMPFRLWFKDRLKDYVLETLSEENLKAIPNIDIRQVRRLVFRHIQGREDNYAMIWCFLVLVNWMKYHHQ